MTELDLNLQSNEGIILKFDSEVYHNDNYVNELYLTNFNLIIVKSKGFFRTTYDVNKMPLSSVKIINNNPQINVRDDEDEDNWELIVQFRNSNETFTFPYTFFQKNKIYQEVAKIANEMCKAINGTNSSAIDTSNNLIGNVKKFLGIKEKQAELQNVTIRCVGCMAPLSGVKGQFIKCKYCDTSQTLK